MSRDQQGCDMLVDLSDDKVVRVYSSPQVIEALEKIQSIATGTLGRKGKIRFTSTAPQGGQATSFMMQTFGGGGQSSTSVPLQMPAQDVGRVVN
jgi:hypothetical protein